MREKVQCCSLTVSQSVAKSVRGTQQTASNSDWMTPPEVHQQLTKLFGDCRRLLRSQSTTDKQNPALLSERESHSRSKPENLCSTAFTAAAALKWAVYISREELALGGRGSAPVPSLSHFHHIIVFWLAMCFATQCCAAHHTTQWYNATDSDRSRSLLLLQQCLLVFCTSERENQIKPKCV